MTKGPLAKQFWDEIPKGRQEAIKKRAAKKIAEYQTLQEIRQEAGLTQAKVSEELEMPQSNVSRLEKNSDMLLSTLQGYIEAIGGKLNLTVELPNKPPIALTGLGDLIDNSKAETTKHSV